MFKPTDVPPRPNSPGCWIRYPSGCPKQKHRPKYEKLQNPNIWNKEEHNGASESVSKCHAREKPINQWCGVSDIVVIYNVEGINEYI